MNNPNNPTTTTVETDDILATLKALRSVEHSLAHASDHYSEWVKVREAIAALEKALGY